MFLKRLDIVGFKSFAERIAVDFVQGVTAVVGPNGSGKSNITDAIRWVLGEQSAKSLRGSKMEDIIFAGSDSRKPLNFAEVTLTLDNEDQSLQLDYQEVSVTRRVFRSGDSEFFINKQSCRLKDIVDLFMDSGLGREAFSIISQGKVEEILNSKPEDRRTIFEEAAGVLKYKIRKQKAEGKLSETEDNLNRVNDILHELENQIEPLKIQASMAKDYLDQKEALEKVEVAVIVTEIEDLHTKWKKVSSSVETNKQTEIKLAADLQGKEAEVEKLRHQMSVLDDSINDLQNVLLQTSEELEKLEGRKEVLKERTKNATQNREQYEININELTEKVSKLNEKKQIVENQIIIAESEAINLKQQLKEKQSELAQLSENIEEKIEELKSEYIDMLNEQAAAKNEISFIHQQLTKNNVRNSKQEESNSIFLKDREEIQLRIVNIKKEIGEIQSKLDSHIHLYRIKQQEYEETKSSYEKQEKLLYQAYQYLQQTKSRKEMLEEMEEGFAGFFQGVKEVLKARKGSLQGIEGAIAELISVSKQYETCIETVLGGSMQHIVVRNEQNARDAISFLRANHYGRATFLPLSVIKGKTLPSNQLVLIEKHADFIGVASELVSYDAVYTDIIQSLLGHVIVTKTLKGANEMAKLLGFRCRFVTLEGDIVNSGGSMTGGAVKQKTTSLLSRKSELDDLNKKLADMEMKTSSLEKKVKQLKGSLSSKESELESLREQSEGLRLSEQAVKSNLRELELKENNMNERLLIYDLNKQEYDSEQRKLTNRKSSIDELLTELQRKISNLDKQIEELTEKKNTQIHSKDTLLTNISELKVYIASINEQITHTKEKYSTIMAELDESNKKLSSFQEELNFLNSEMSQSTSGVSHLEEAAKDKLDEKNDILSLISSRREERLNMQKLYDDLDIEIKELKRQYKGLSNILKDEEVKLTRLDVELDNKLAHLREEYLLSFEGAKEAYPLTMPIDDARKKVKLIKLSLDELGTVNLGAIEEYERVSERYEFLFEQKNDLRNAKDTLFQVIDEMDVEMKKRFKQTFEGISVHFESVFQELFGGGRAELRLTNPDDLLNTGVDIVAQPPGKKLQNLSLLSGGERALTAIALLFSILKVRPVPFCILDEVEAALDEANVYRFSQYLKSFSKESQFIVITHRKGTMEEADVLYGVTMQESGVSKLVSVHLEEMGEMVAQ